VEAVSNDFAPDVVKANVCLIYNRGIEHSGPMITGRTGYCLSGLFLKGSASAEINNNAKIISISV